jgi:mono/diheme cytochrome c family protein
VPVTQRPHRRLVAVLAAAALSLVLAGCGETVGYTDASGDKTNGKELFTKGCGSCHVLADAGTKGQIGPNLDYAFFQSRREGMTEDTIRQVVRGQIAYAVADPVVEGAPGMPRDIYKGSDANDVAAYVAGVAGLDEDEDGKPDEGSGGGGVPPDAKDGKAIFASAGCGSCHTLADAGSKGAVGPNLDQAKPTKALAVDRVTNGQGGMPSFKDQLSAEQIEAVATYVSSAAGK